MPILPQRAFSESEKNVRALGGNFPFDGRSQFAASQSHCDVIAECYLIRRTQNFPVSIVSDCVAALEYAKRAAFFELQSRGLEALAFCNKRAMDSRFQRHSSLLHDVAPTRHSRAQIKRRKTHLRRAIAATFAPHQPLEGRDKRPSILIDFPAHHQSASAQIKRANARARLCEALARHAQSQPQTNRK